MDELFEQSDSLAAELLALIDLPIIEGERIEISDTACSLAFEHWHAVRSLLAQGFLPSALVVHRAQFEALVRSVWLAYAAREADLAKLTVTLDLESEQAAKSMPTVSVMMAQIQEKAPVNAYDALARFKEHNWKALNSCTHAGIHPLRRHADGYPEALSKAVLCNANGVGVMTCMQAVVLSIPVPTEALNCAIRTASVQLISSTSRRRRAHRPSDGSGGCFTRRHSRSREPSQNTHPRSQ